MTLRTLENVAPNVPPHEAEDRFDPVLSALAKTGALLLDLADQATRLGVFAAEHASHRTVAGSLCRRAELARHLGRRLAISFDSDPADGDTLLTEAILALDGIAIEVEYASELAADSKIKNQVARSRLAVTMAGCAIDDARRVLAARA